MGNHREIRQVTLREGLGVVIRVRTNHLVEVARLLDEAGEIGTFYTYLITAGEPINIPNLDGPTITVDPQAYEQLVIQSGGKMWCGYSRFVEHIRGLAPHLEDARFFVGDEEDYIDEFRIVSGELEYQRVNQGGWYPLDDYLRTANTHFI